MKYKIFLLLFFIFTLLLAGHLSFAQEETSTITIDNTANDVIEITGEQIDTELATEAISAADIDQAVSSEDLSVSEPNILPDSIFYPLKDLWRGVTVAFTFNNVKKAEKRLQHANERLLEAQTLAEEKGDDEKAQEYLNKAMEKYTDELAKVEKITEKIATKAGENPDLEKLKGNMADWEIKRQKVFDKIKANAPEGVVEKIIDAREKSAEYFGQAMEMIASREEIAEKLNTALENQFGSEFKNFKNLEVLKVLVDNVPAEAKEAIKLAEAMASKRLGEAVSGMNIEERGLKMKKYLEKLSGEPLRHLEILDEIKNDANLPDDILGDIETMKDQAVNKIENNFRAMNQEQVRNRLLEPFIGGGVEKIRVMRQLEDKISSEFKEKIGDINREVIKNLNNDLIRDMSQERIVEGYGELAKEMEANPDSVAFQIIKDIEENLPVEQKAFVSGLKEQITNKFAENYSARGDKFLEIASSHDPEQLEVMQEIRDYVPVKDMAAVEKLIRIQVGNIEEKVAATADPEKIIEYRERLEANADTKNEILRYSPAFTSIVNNSQVEKIKEKLNSFEDPGEMLTYRERLEEKLNLAPVTKEKILKSQPNLFKEFDAKQLEVVKEKISEIADPGKLLEYRERVEAVYTSAGNTVKEVLVNKPNFLKSVDDEQLKAIETKLENITDPEKALEYRQKLNKGLEGNAGLKDKILENRPDFMDKVEQYQTRAIESGLGRVSDPTERRALEEKIKQVAPEIIRSINTERVNAADKINTGSSQPGKDILPARGLNQPLPLKPVETSSGGSGAGVVAPKDKESLPVKQLTPVSPERAEVSPGGSATNGPVSGGEGGVGVK